MKLIVTADDVGLHEGMNAGAARAHLEGIVTSCSVVANGAALADAVARLADCPRMSVGAHLALVEERPVSDPRAISSLVDAEGRFFRNFKVFAARYALGRIRIEEVERELRAQIEKLIGEGLTLTHLNGHQHLHALPAIFGVVRSLAEEYGIGYVRIPCEAAVRGTSATRAISMRVLNVFGETARRRMSPGRTVTTMGIADAGHLNAERFISMIDRMSGDAELVCHPGIDDVSIGRTYDWGYEWDEETRTLCDAEVIRALADRGIALIRPEEAGN